MKKIMLAGSGMKYFTKSILITFILILASSGYANFPSTADKVAQLSVFEVNLRPEKLVVPYDKAYSDKTLEITEHQNRDRYYRLTAEENAHLNNDIYTRLVSEDLKPEVMYHFEIPLEVVGLNFANRMNPKIKESLVFTKNGKKFVRWILNPGSKRIGKDHLSYDVDVSGPNREILVKKQMSYGLAIQRYLEYKGLDATVYTRYIGYRTASRSFLVRDSETGAAFMTKTSTVKAPGKWSTSKYLTSEEAHDARVYADHLHEQNNRHTFQNFTIMDEPGSLSLYVDSSWKEESVPEEERLFYREERQHINDAVIIRDITPILVENGKIYLPLFAVFGSYGKMIAHKNGAEDVEKYWTEHGLNVVAKGLAELAIKTGLQHDSPHSQNFLLVFDENYKPEDRLVIRDLPDFYVDKNILNAVTPDASKIIDSLDDKSVVRDYTVANFEPFRGNREPDWLLPGYQKADRWNELFHEVYFQEILRLTGARQNEITKEVRFNENGSNKHYTYKFSNNILKILNYKGLKNISCENIF